MQTLTISIASLLVLALLLSDSRAEPPVPSSSPPSAQDEHLFPPLPLAASPYPSNPLPPTAHVRQASTHSQSTHGQSTHGQSTPPTATSAHVYPSPARSTTPSADVTIRAIGPKLMIAGQTIDLAQFKHVLVLVPEKSHPSRDAADHPPTLYPTSHDNPVSLFCNQFELKSTGDAEGSKSRYSISVPDGFCLVSENGRMIGQTIQFENGLAKVTGVRVDAGSFRMESSELVFSYSIGSINLTNKDAARVPPQVPTSVY